MIKKSLTSSSGSNGSNEFSDCGTDSLLENKLELRTDVRVALDVDGVEVLADIFALAALALAGLRGGIMNESSVQFRTQQRNTQPSSALINESDLIRFDDNTRCAIIKQDERRETTCNDGLIHSMHSEHRTTIQRYNDSLINDE